LSVAAVQPGSAQDHELTLQLVVQAEKNADVVDKETIGDCSFGDSQTE
jgi:hypothetical protein